ncbi:PadR family transcriptional regulator, partial [Planococcus sp. SIMBA_160]
GFGSIYPALKRLTEDELVICRELEQTNRPDKKVYRITPKGRQALFEAINKPPAEDKFRSDFAFVIFFADLLEPRDLDR